MKKQLTTLTVGAVLAAGIASPALASGPRQCDIEGNCPVTTPIETPDPTITCDPYGPQPVPVECRDDDIPRRDDSAFPAQIHSTTTTDEPQPEFVQPATLPETGQETPLLVTAALAALYYGRRWIRSRA